MKIKTPNMKMLITLLEQNTPSGREDATRRYLLHELDNIGFKCEVDAYGNLYGVRGIADKYPLLNAHMDIVDDSFGYGRGISRYKSRKAFHTSDYGYGYGYGYGYEYDYDAYKDIAAGESNDLAADLATEYEEEALNILLSGYIGEATTAVNWELLEIDTAQDFSEDEAGLLHSLKTELLALDAEMTAAPLDGRLGSLRRLAEELPNILIELDYDMYEAYMIEFEGITAEFLGGQEVMNDYVVSYDVKSDIIRGSGGRVLGGDDKCGIFIALEALKQLKNMPAKVLFTVEEEIGCIGVDSFVSTNVDFFDNVGYNLTIDRRGSSDLLHRQCGRRSCSWEFAGKLAYHGILAGIPVTLNDGNVADVITIRDYVPNSVNMSAGYYEAHSHKEYVVWGEVCSIVAWVMRILNDKSLLYLKPFREFSREIIIPKSKNTGGKTNGK